MGEPCSVEWRMRMLFTLLLTALTATSGEGTDYSEGEGHLVSGGYPLLTSGLAVSGRQEGGASLTFTGESTTGNGEREGE